MRRFALTLVSLIVMAVAGQAQPRITALDHTGRLTWTNSARVGAYQIEWASSPSFPWQPFAPPHPLHSVWAETNRVSVNVLLSNRPVFYRVGWQMPEASGKWDFQFYDSQESLVATGTVELASKSLCLPRIR